MCLSETAEAQAARLESLIGSIRVVLDAADVKNGSASTIFDALSFLNSEARDAFQKLEQEMKRECSK